MNNSGNDLLASGAFYVIVAAIAFVAIVVISEWLRVRRDRNAYKQTRRNANNMVERQKQRRSASNS